MAQLPKCDLVRGHDKLINQYIGVVPSTFEVLYSFRIPKIYHLRKDSNGSFHLAIWPFGLGGSSASDGDNMEVAAG